MIAYEELCEAIARWRARASGEEPAPAAQREAAPAYDAAADEGVTPTAVEHETTNEIDIDGAEVVEP